MFVSHNDIIDLSFAYLNNLVTLDASHNKIIHIQQPISPLCIQNLHLEHNNLKSLPPQLSNFVKLLHLDISNNHLTTLPDSLSHLSRLTILNVSFNKLTSLPRDMHHIVWLEELLVNNNLLTCLPTSLSLVHLFLLDISHNPDLIDVPELNTFQLRLDNNQYKTLNRHCIHIQNVQILINLK